MPNKTKDTNKNEDKKILKKEPSSKKTSTTKKASLTTSEKVPTNKKNNTVKKVVSTTSSSSKKTADKSKKANKNSTSTKKIDKKAKLNKASKTEVKSNSTKTTRKKIDVIEYYDLPYRYNETIVRVLAQTPNIIFVYWDISDKDKEKYISQYGEYFFNNTKPVLIIHNKTMNYSYEIDINDFANSWYLHIPDSNCDYQVELGRRSINEYVNIENNYLPIYSSNNIETPNDHILFNNINKNVYFKNVKTNIVSKKEIYSLYLLKKIDKLCNIKDFYKELYPEELIDFDSINLKNPSSGNPTSTFK